VLLSRAHGPPAKLRNGRWSLISAGRDLAAQMSNWLAPS
jgi:hypothetical protein